MKNGEAQYGTSEHNGEEGVLLITTDFGALDAKLWRVIAYLAHTIRASSWMNKLDFYTPRIPSAKP